MMTALTNDPAGQKWVYFAETLEEAAKKAGLDPKAVKETVEKYNKGIKESNDEFGRKSLTSGFGKPVPIEKGPFYIMPTTAALIGTYCGLKINEKAQVINVFNEVIPALYAVGELTGGVHGAAYMTGTAFGKAICFGRIAVDSIAGK